MTITPLFTRPSLETATRFVLDVFSQSGACPQNGSQMFRQIESEEAGEPENCADGDGGEEEMCVVEEGESVVTQEGDYEVIVESDEV